MICAVSWGQAGTEVGETAVSRTDTTMEARALPQGDRNHPHPSDVTTWFQNIC